MVEEGLRDATNRERRVIGNVAWHDERGWRVMLDADLDLDRDGGAALQARSDSNELSADHRAITAVVGLEVSRLCPTLIRAF